MGFMFRMSFSFFWAVSKSSFSFSTSSRLRSSWRSDRVVSKVISTSPFFTMSPWATFISVTVWVEERNTVWILSVETGP